MRLIKELTSSVAKPLHSCSSHYEPYKTKMWFGGSKCHQNRLQLKLAGRALSKLDNGSTWDIDQVFHIFWSLGSLCSYNFVRYLYIMQVSYWCSGSIKKLIWKNYMLYICRNVHRADLLLVYKTTLLAYKHCFISFKTACLTRSESKIQTAVIAFLKILKTSTLLWKQLHRLYSQLWKLFFHNYLYYHEWY